MFAWFTVITVYIAHLHINGHGNYGRLRFFLQIKAAGFNAWGKWSDLYTVYDGFLIIFSVFLKSFFPPAAAQEAADDCPAEGGEGQQDEQEDTNHI